MCIIIFFPFMIQSQIIILVLCQRLNTMERFIFKKKRKDFVIYKYPIMIYLTVSIIKFMKQGNMFGK